MDVLVQQSTTGALGRTAEYYKNTREALLALLVQESTTGAIERLCW